MKRQSKVMSIVALAVCVVGLTIGFAAFSNTLTISSSATVKPNESDFNVEFSTSMEELSYGIIEATGYEGIAKSSATIKEGSDTIEDWTVTFTAPDIVDATFYVHNTGKYTAYLNQIEFENALNSDTFKKCTPKSGEANPLVDAACDDIFATVSFYDLGEIGKTTSGIDEISIAPGEATAGAILVGYNNFDTGAALADEEFTVEFGDINLLWESVD